MNPSMPQFYHIPRMHDPLLTHKSYYNNLAIPVVRNFMR